MIKRLLKGVMPRFPLSTIQGPKNHIQYLNPFNGTCLHSKAMIISSSLMWCFELFFISMDSKDLPLVLNPWIYSPNHVKALESHDYCSKYIYGTISLLKIKGQSRQVLCGSLLVLLSLDSYKLSLVPMFPDSSLTNSRAMRPIYSVQNILMSLNLMWLQRIPLGCHVVV